MATGISCILTLCALLGMLVGAFVTSHHVDPNLTATYDEKVGGAGVAIFFLLVQYFLLVIEMRNGAPLKTID